MAYINEENGEILVYNRHTARDLAFKYIFQWNVNGRDIAEFTEETETMDFTATAFSGMVPFSIRPAQM